MAKRTAKSKFEPAFKIPSKLIREKFFVVWDIYVQHFLYFLECRQPPGITATRVFFRFQLVTFFFMLLEVAMMNERLAAVSAQVPVHIFYPRKMIVVQI